MLLILAAGFVQAQSPRKEIAEGNALYQQDKYEEAMAQFEIVRYPGAYSRAFKYYRKYQAEKYFGLIVVGLAALIIVIRILVKYYKKRARGI